MLCAHDNEWASCPTCLGACTCTTCVSMASRTAPFSVSPMAFEDRPVDPGIAQASHATLWVGDEGMDVDDLLRLLDEGA